MNESKNYAIKIKQNQNTSYYLNKDEASFDSMVLEDMQSPSLPKLNQNRLILISDYFFVLQMTIFTSCTNNKNCLK